MGRWREIEGHSAQRVTDNRKRELGILTVSTFRENKPKALAVGKEAIRREKRFLDPEFSMCVRK